MYKFLTNNREELLARCREKVALRPKRQATEQQLENGMPMFLEQLQRTLLAEEGHESNVKSLRISGASGGDMATSEIGASAAAHGKTLLALGFTIDQVVHDYGDMCQAITDLAVERDAPFAINEFRTLNRCLDNAIADAVTTFSHESDALVTAEIAATYNQRIGFLMHEVRNALGTATLAVCALEASNLTISSSTGTVLKRNLNILTALTNRTLEEIKKNESHRPSQEIVAVAALFSMVKQESLLNAEEKGCHFIAQDPDASWHVRVNVMSVLSAISNLIQNAFKFTLPNTTITLLASRLDDNVCIGIADHCGGLPSGVEEKLFTPFFCQSGQGVQGLGLGLSIAKEAVVAEGGALTVKNIPGTGCVFTINLPMSIIT